MELHYYAANNHFIVDEATGFSNVWFVISFSAKRERDDYVRKYAKARAINAAEVEKYGGVKYRHVIGDKFMPEPTE